jgi:hypothetical protein
VGQLLENIGVAQPNMSQHLNILFRSGGWASAVKVLRCFIGLQMTLQRGFAERYARKWPSVRT